MRSLIKSKRKKKHIFGGTAFIMMAISFIACDNKEKEEVSEEIVEEDISLEDVWDDDLMELDGDELAMMEDDGDALSEDDEMFVLSDEEMEEMEIDIDEELESIDMSVKENEEAEDKVSDVEYEIDEKETYTSKDDVAAYLHIYKKLPSNYITRSEAEKLGLNSKGDNLEKVAPGKFIGGDKYTNENGMFPVEDGRQYYQCEIEDEEGNGKYLIYSNDGLIFYTDENYEMFVQLY